MTGLDHGVEDRHLEAYLEMSRDQLLYVIAKRYGDVTEYVDLSKKELARQLVLEDVDSPAKWLHPQDLEQD